MGDTNFRGPVNSMGATEWDSPTPSSQTFDGPSLFYQGFGFPDPRNVPFAKDSIQPGQQAAFQMGSVVVTVNQIPQARSSTVIAAAQIGTATVAVSLATVAVNGVASAASIGFGVPIIPVGTTVVQFVNALDFGFTTGTTVAGSTTVVVVDNTLFRAGSWVVIGGAGNSAGTRALLAQVQSIATSNLTTITVLPAAGTGLSSAPIGQGNLLGGNNLPLGTQFGPATASASAHSFAGGFSAGLARYYNPREMLTRTITLQGVTSLTAYSALVSGYDLYGNAMTEVITMTAQTTVTGKKAFKYIASITSGTTTAGSQTVAFGLGDTFGLPLTGNAWETIDAKWNGASVTNNNGFVAGVQTAATSTSGDVRGSLMLSTAVITGSGISTAVSAVTTNGTGRLFIAQYLTPTMMVYTNPNNPVPLFGPAQSTATT